MMENKDRTVLYLSHPSYIYIYVCKLDYQIYNEPSEAGTVGQTQKDSFLFQEAQRVAHILCIIIGIKKC